VPEWMQAMDVVVCLGTRTVPESSFRAWHWQTCGGNSAGRTRRDHR
jgi:hypothetical protein